MHTRNLLPLCLLILFTLTTACAPRDRRLVVVADGEIRTVTVSGQAATVGAALREAGIDLGELDQVDPPSYREVADGLRIVITRVQENELVVNRPLPYPREVRRDATLPRGETRLLQLGQNGIEQQAFRVRLEDGEEAERTLVASDVLTPAVTEVLILGTRGEVGGVPITGTLTYLAGGNAWLIRGESSLRRALTTTGDLDGHVFNLSPDGRWLLFSRRPLGGGAGVGGLLNSLWVVRTDLLNEEPIYVKLDNVLWAAWQPAAEALSFAYTTAARVPTPPGWRAYNDLFLVTLDPATGQLLDQRQLHPEERTAPFAWWGRSWRWAPDGKRLAWADASSLGTTSLLPRTSRHFTFVPYETLGAWIWTPTPSWHPEGRRYVAVVHGPPRTGESPSRAERFDLWSFPGDGGEGRMLAEQVGMWAMPVWSDAGELAYGQAEDPETSVTSRYRIVVTDTEGRNPRVLFPEGDQPGVDIPWVAWSPQNEALVTVWQGDLYLVEKGSGQAQPLTIEGGASHPQWR